MFFPMKASYDRLFRNNHAWAAEKVERDPTYFERMAQGQSPQYLLIGCSDSRVPPNEITQTEPGEMFIHRNVANIVVHTDMNLMSVLQYAVEVLQVKHIIVMGHYRCGGVAAALENRWHGLIDEWLRNIKDVYRLHRQALEAIEEPERRLRRMVELNVQEQVYNLLKTPIIQRAWTREDGRPQVHGWVYDIETGLLQDQEKEIRAMWESFDDIYKLALTPEEAQLGR